MFKSALDEGVCLQALSQQNIWLCVYFDPGSPLLVDFFVQQVHDHGSALGVRDSDLSQLGTGKDVIGNFVNADCFYTVRKFDSLLAKSGSDANGNLVVFKKKSFREGIVLQPGEHIFGNCGNVVTKLYDIAFGGHVVVADHGVAESITPFLEIVDAFAGAQVFDIGCTCLVQKVQAVFHRAFIVDADAVVFAVGGFVVVKDNGLVDFFQNGIVSRLHFRGKNNDAGNKLGVAFFDNHIGFVFRFINVGKAVEIAAGSCFCVKGAQNFGPQIQLRVADNLFAVVDDEHLDQTVRCVGTLEGGVFREHAAVVFQFFYAFQNLLAGLFVYAGFAVDCEGDGGFGNAKMSGDIDHFYFHRDTCLSGENVVGENCLRVELYGLLMFIFKHFKLLI